MKYIYKKTDIVVESDTELDSMLYVPIIDANSEAEKKNKKAVKVKNNG